MLKADAAAGKAGVQVCVRRGEPLGVIGMNGEDNAFVELIVYLGQFMAFVLVDDKQISRGNGIKAVVNEELFAAGDGIIELITVMDVHVHGFFFFVKVCHSKGFGVLAVFDGNFAGGDFFHGAFSSFLFSLRVQYSAKVHNLQYFEKYLNRPGEFFQVYYI